MLLRLSVVQAEVRFTRLNTDNGLSMSVVNAIYQDSRGFMWFGTEDGLNRYDGIRFTVFRNNIRDQQSLSDNWILSIFEDRQQNLWIGTNDGGVNRYDRATGRFVRYTFEDNCSNCIGSNKVKHISQLADGSLIMGTDKGISLFNVETGRWKSFKVFGEGAQVEYILETRDQRVWVGTFDYGLFEFDRKNEKFIPHQDLGSAGEFKVTYNNRIKVLKEDGRGALWIGTHGAGLIRYDVKRQKFTYYLPDGQPGSISNKSVFALYQPAAGGLWAGTYGGINILDQEQRRFTTLTHNAKDPSSLSSNYIRAVFEDNAGSVWVGTNGGGLNVFHKSSNQFGYHKTDPADPEKLGYPPMAFEEDPAGNIWMGTFGGGIYKMSPEGNFTHYPKEINRTHENILSLLYADSIIWIGSWGNGLNKFDLRSGSFGNAWLAGNEPDNLIDNNVTCLEKSAGNGIWIGTLKGLCHFNPATQQFDHITKSEGLPVNMIFSLRSDGPRLWVGTSGGGLCVMDETERKVTVFADEEKGLSNNTVTSIYDDGKGFLWVGTRIGLNRVEKATGKIRTWYKTDGLPNDYVHGILPDGAGNLWISTVWGISRFTPPMGDDQGEFRNYFSIDGLQDNEFNQGAFFRSSRGKLYFGGINGFNSFHPAQVRNNEHVPPVWITGFKKFGKAFELDTAISSKKKIELSYRDNFFEFEFVSLDFVMPGKNLYSYKMEGFDEDWTPPSNRNFASYTNLGGGDYTFRVRATNNDGIWNEKGTAIQIKIIPPFYKTPWFYALCIVAGLAGVGVFTRYRTGKIKKEKRVLEARVRERTIELAQKNKDITSSIQYAQRIQDAILPRQELIFSGFPDAFILYKPKDIVSGDFYWFGSRNGKRIIAAVDCTGHGVPGAFMSMIGHNLLNQIINENGITSPAKILEELNKGVQAALKQHDDQGSRDGMDIALCTFSEDGRTLAYAGAFRSLYLVRNGQLEIVEGARFPIGGAQMKEERRYIQKEVEILPGDSVYLFSDGYADQFGGPEGKKFKVKRFQKLLMEIHQLTMKEQEQVLGNNLETWMGAHEQVDDVLVIGIRV